MALITRTYTFTDGTTAYGSQVESEIANITNLLLSLDAGTTTWDIVKVVNGSATPLIADNATGSNHVADFKVNGVIKVAVDGTGILQASNTIAMNATKITGLANGTASTDGAAFGQITAANLVGTATNDSATAGNIGEYVSATCNSTNFPSTGTYGDATSIVLTAGDWDISAQWYYNTNAATHSGDTIVGVSTTTGNASTGLTQGVNTYQWTVTAGTTHYSGSLPRVRFSLSGGTTVYLKFQDTYASATPNISGILSARRVR